jgi:hypothetical protein
VSRVLLLLPSAALETALLQDGHAVRRLDLPAGPLAVVAAWSARRAARTFTPDCIVAGAGDDAAAHLAEQLGCRLALPPADDGYLADPFLPTPFRHHDTPPSLGVVGGAAGAITLPADGQFLVPPDIAVLADGPPAALPRWMAAGCAIVAPDTAAVREHLREGETALLHAPGDAAAGMALAHGLIVDPDLWDRLAMAARRDFEIRHLAARDALREAVGSMNAS